MKYRDFTVAIIGYAYCVYNKKIKNYPVIPVNPVKNIWNIIHEMA
jgi:hypothetical protein